MPSFSGSQAAPRSHNGLLANTLSPKNAVLAQRNERENAIMAKKKSSRKVHKAGAKRSSGKGQIPLPILEKRLKSLYSIVDRRGGSVPGE